MRYELKIIMNMWLCFAAASLVFSENMALTNHPADLTPVVSKERRLRFLEEDAAKLKQSIIREIHQFSNTVSNWQEYDITYYDIAWYPHPETQTLTGCVGIFGKPTVPLLDSVIVNFTDELPIDSVYNSSGHLNYSRYDNHVLVRLDRTYAEGETFGFYVAYDGYTSYALFFRFYNDYPFIDHGSEPMNSRYFWPCNDIPADKADSIDVRITVDTGLTAVSNGVLISDTDHGDGTHTAHWQSHYPIVTYLVCMAVGKYVTWTDYYKYSPADSMPVPNYVFYDLYDSIKPYYSVAPFVLGVYADLFCEYPFINEKYGQTMTMMGGMEYQTSTFIGYDRPDSNYVLIHEMAHSWWGDLITCRDWHNAWLNEGFATYTEALYYEYLYGSTIFHQYIDDYETFSGYSPYCHDTTSFSEMFGAAYGKGAWALHMMRHMIGDSTFFAILHQYLESYAYKTAITEDFQQICEDVSGMDMDFFFNEWIYNGYYPIYYYSYAIRPDAESGAWNTYLFVEQTQTQGQEAYIMPIDIVLTFGAEDTTIVVWNDQRRTTYTFVTSERPTTLFFDLRNWLNDWHYHQPFTIHIMNNDIAPGIQGQWYGDTLNIVSVYGNYVADIVEGRLPSGWSLHPTSGIISGLTYETGEFTFTVEAHDAIAPSLIDVKEFTVYVSDVGFGPGDANLDGSSDVGDAVYLINYIFKGGPPPTVPNFADVNADCAVNVADAVYLINYVFKGGPAPLPGCVE